MCPATSIEAAERTPVFSLPEYEEVTPIWVKTHAYITVSSFEVLRTAVVVTAFTTTAKNTRARLRFAVVTISGKKL